MSSFASPLKHDLFRRIYIIVQGPVDSAYVSPRSSFRRSISLYFCFSFVSFGNQRSRNRTSSMSICSVGQDIKLASPNRLPVFLISSSTIRVRTFGSQEDGLRPAERTELLVPVLHFDHAADAEHMAAVQTDR